MMVDEREALSKENLDRAFSEADARRAFWEGRHAEFVKRYPDEFVAVLDGEVVAHSPDLMALVDLLGSDGLKPTDVWMEYVDTGSRTLIL